MGSIARIATRMVVSTIRVYFLVITFAVLCCVDALPARLIQFVLWLPFASTIQASILRILRRYMGQFPKDQSPPVTPSAAECCRAAVLCCRAAVLCCADAVPDRLTRCVLWLPFASTILRILRRLGQFPQVGSPPLTPSAAAHAALAGSGLYAGKLLARKLQPSGSRPTSNISRVEG